MPTYVYECDNCGKMDIRQSIRDMSVSQCPKCMGINFKKVFSAAPIQFKGSGFYVTDSRGK
jgi:putative FmdB family regulatory protein